MMGLIKILKKIWLPSTFHWHDQNPHHRCQNHPGHQWKKNGQIPPQGWHRTKRSCIKFPLQHSSRKYFIIQAHQWIWDIKTLSEWEQMTLPLKYSRTTYIYSSKARTSYPSIGSLPLPITLASLCELTLSKMKTEFSPNQWSKQSNHWWSSSALPSNCRSDSVCRCIRHKNRWMTMKFTLTSPIPSGRINLFREHGIGDTQPQQEPQQSSSLWWHQSWHNLLTNFDPTSDHVSQYHRLVHQFLWKSRPQVQTQRLHQPTKRGGMNIPNLNAFTTTPQNKDTFDSYAMGKEQQNKNWKTKHCNSG